MKTMWSRLHVLRSFMLVAVAVVASLLTPRGFGADTITLKDGTILEGTISREVGGIVWIKTKVAGVETEKMVLPEEVSKIVRDAAAATPAADATDSTTDEAAAAAPSQAGALVLEGEEPAYKPGVPRAMVLTLGDEESGHMVGVYMTAEIVRRAIPLMEKELGTDRTGILVLRIHSGGGYGLEVQRLSDLIENELKPRFRVVGWIDHAISAAAMTAHCIEEIYFTTDGEYGGCTGFYGGADRPVEGYELEEALAKMERISDRGKHDRLIMRAMQIQQPLSATIDENGNVKYFGDATSGEMVVNREREVLTFNAESALRVKFSSGTADTIDDLARLMRVPEIQWVGKRVRGLPWPISKAEEMQMKFRAQTKEDEAALGRLQATYNRRLQAAQQTPREDRGAFVGQARQAFERIKATFKNNPNQILWTFGGQEQYRQWQDEQERILRDLMR